MAHVFFVLEKYNEAIRYYEPIVKKNFDNMLSLTAIVVANLCVSYIMVNKNEEAEEVMKRLEAEEEKAAEMAESEKQVLLSLSRQIIIICALWILLLVPFIVQKPTTTLVLAGSSNH